MKLICFDMDGVIFEHSNFWVELHKALGTWQEGKVVTEKYLWTNYEMLVKEVVGRLWKGKPAKEYYDLVARQTYKKGACETIQELKKRGYKVAIISSGPKDLAKRAQHECGVDYIYTNELVIENGVVLGTADMKYWPIRATSKADALRTLCEEHMLDLKDIIAVGHDDGDIKMARTAGFSIALNSHSEELKKYCNVVLEGDDVRVILPVIEQFEQQRI